jgi:hypothetical protein
MGCVDIDRTYELLNKSVEEHDPLIIVMSHNPPFPGHDDDPRFHAFRRRMNLDPVQMFPQR